MVLPTPQSLDRRRQALDLIEVLADVESDSFIAKRVVVDGLLDLRNVVDVDDQAAIDRLLRSVPGVNVVESSWWTHELMDLRILFADR